MADNNRTDDHTPAYQAAGKSLAGDHSDHTVQRSWRELAAAVLQATDHDKVLRLAQELCDAVDEQVLGRRRKTEEC